MVRAAIAIGRIAVTRQDDFGAHRFGPRDCAVDLIDLEPEQQAVTRRQVMRVANWSVMMLLLPAVKLQDQLSRKNEPLIVGPAVHALTAEQSLIPPAARLNIANAYQRLRSHQVASP